MSVGWKVEGKWNIKSTNREGKILPKCLKTLIIQLLDTSFLDMTFQPLKMFPNINFKAKIIDSLALSHYLFNDRLKHGLEDYGVEFGYEKVKISEEEWENLTYEKGRKMFKRRSN